MQRRHGGFGNAVGGLDRAASEVVGDRDALEPELVAKEALDDLGRHRPGVTAS